MDEIESNNNNEKNEESFDQELLDEKSNIELEKTREELKEYKELLIRTRAEMENQRKRLEREIDNARNYAIQDFITKLLPAKDSMEKSLYIYHMEDNIDAETLIEGLSAILRICNETFSNAGLEELNPEGETFDPEFHEAMAVKNIEGEKPNTVLKVFQRSLT